MMKQILYIASLACLTAGPLAHAATPLDFSYRIAGDTKIRPLLVFNDGIDVYVQPNPESGGDYKVVGATAERQGPYIVVKGLAESFRLEGGKKGRVEISYEGKRKPPLSPNGAQAGQSAPTAATPMAEAQQGKRRGEVKGTLQVCTVELSGESKTSAFIVSFPAKSAVLSKAVAAQLAEMFAGADAITSVEIFAEAPGKNAGRLAEERALAIRREVQNAKVPTQHISVKTREYTGIGTEVRVVRGAKQTCGGQSTTGQENIFVQGQGDQMKKTAAAAAVAVAAAAAPQTALACGQLDDYQVVRATFSGQSLKAAMTKLTKDMPFQVVVQGGEHVRLSATDLSGPLGGVLDKMATEAGFKVKQDRCLLMVTGQQAAIAWRIKGGEMIAEAFKRWAKTAGWQDVAWEAPDLVAEADVPFSGAFEEAIALAIEALNANGASLKVRFYDGNKVIRVSEKK